MQANGVTPRRVFLYSLLGAGVAFGGNLFGVTSGVLGSLAPEASRDARLDVLFPVGGFKRYCVMRFVSFSLAFLLLEVSRKFLEMFLDRF